MDRIKEFVLKFGGNNDGHRYISLKMDAFHEIINYLTMEKLDSQFISVFGIVKIERQTEPLYHYDIHFMCPFAHDNFYHVCDSNCLKIIYKNINHFLFPLAIKQTEKFEIETVKRPYRNFIIRK